MAEQTGSVDISETSMELSQGEIELRKYEAKLSLWKTGIFGAIATILVAIAGAAGTVISENIKSERETNLKGWEIEQKYIDTFVVDALNADVEKRVKYARIYSILAPTEEARNRWVNYLEFVMKDYFQTSALSEDLETRARIAQYFSIISPDASERERWSQYYHVTQKQLDEAKLKLKELERNIKK